MRGYCGIGIWQPKFERNVGTLFRSAMCLGNTDFVFTIGGRYQEKASDTTKTTKHLPLWSFETIEEFLYAAPKNASMVAVEQTPDSVDIVRFVHPERAIYILGNEACGIPQEMRDAAIASISIPTDYPLNVAAAGSIVLFDRMSKRT